MGSGLSSPARLDPRLLQTAAYIREGAVFADVGCDHGYLSIHLMERRGARRGYACDLRPQPLARARANLQAAGLANRVELRLADGLSGLEGCGITDVAIAGMGGEMIAAILERAPFVRQPSGSLPGPVRLALQPMSRENLLRRWLWDNGFAILEESAVLSGKFAYLVLCARHSGQPAPSRQQSPEDRLFWDYTGLLPRLLEPQANPQQRQAATRKLARTAAYLEEMSRGLANAPDRRELALALGRVAGRIQKLL